MHLQVANQSFAMRFAINVLLVFGACFATSGSVSAPFPREKIAIYKYYGNVEASTIEPAPYSSRFALEAKLWVIRDTSDPSLKNAYYMALSNVETSMCNGKTAACQRTSDFTMINNTAKVIQQPFLIIYDDNGKLQGVKIPPNEVEWSRNMKMAIASMLQLDWSRIKVEEPMKSRTFISKENTIHGDCSVTYEVDANHRINPNGNVFVVKKFFMPTKCRGYPDRAFDHVDSERCEADKEKSLNVASKRYIEIEKREEDVLIKKLVAHGRYEFTPWNARSEAHFILTNATFALDDVAPVGSISLPPMNFIDVPIIHDMTYQKPRGHYALDAAVDVTHGRHVVNQRTATTELRKLITEAAYYLEEDHLVTRRSNWRRGQTINRILQTMGYMDVRSFQRVFNYYEDLTLVKDVTMKNIFVEMIPQVGTTASCLFALKMIKEHKLDNATAVVMLAKLPLNVRLPTQELLIEMMDLAELGNATHIEVRKAGILSFASLVGRTFRDGSVPKGAQFPLRAYLQDVFEHVKNESDYRMKIVYLMALKNVQLPEICELLSPIIRGELNVSKNAVHLRLLAIWAIERAIESDYDYALDLLWPVMANQTLPIKLRIAAYEILMHQAMSDVDVYRIHSFMLDESNEHLYNYHYTTMQGIANSVDPCKLKLRESARNIMRFTRIRDSVPFTLSSAYSFDYKDEKYNHAEKLRVGTVVNEVTGAPEVLQFDHIVTNGRKPVSDFALRVHVEGVDKLINAVTAGQSIPLTRHKVLKVLKQAARDMPTLKNFHIDLVLVHKGRAVFVFHYNEELWHKMWSKLWEAIMAAMMTAILKAMSGRPLEPEKPPIHRRDWNTQYVSHDHLHEEQITSDMGLPIVLETSMPVLASVRLNSSRVDKRIDTEFDGRIWRHGEYSMSIYNPLTDTWHAVRRSTAMDVRVPFKAIVEYHKELQQMTISFPNVTDLNGSAGGFMIHAKDSVTVIEGEAGRLKQSCATCRHHEDVFLGTPGKNSYQTIIDSKDTGLQYTMAMFDCGTGVTPVSFATELYRVFKSQRKNDWNDMIVRGIMATHQQMKNMIISPQVVSCGTLLRIVPSPDHAISRIVFGKSASEIQPDLQKFNVTVTADVIAASTQSSARMWDLNLHADLTAGRTKEATIRLTRKTPGEKNFNIYVRAHTEYTTDPKQGFAMDQQVTINKLLIAFGHSDDDQILRHDHNVIILTLMGELSKEQKKQFREDITNGACANDIANPLYASPTNAIPKTLNCFNQFIRHTTLKKYHMEIIRKEIPDYVTIPSQYIEEFLRSHLQPNLRFTNSRSVQESIELTIHNETVDISVTTPTRGYDLVDVGFGKSRFTGFGSLVHPVWYFPLQNTQFNISDLIRYTTNTLRVCSVYPLTVLTGDGQSVPFEMSGNWTLISGDHTNSHYAVFGKMIGTNMAVKVYLSESEVEIVPSEDNSVRVTADGRTFHELSEIEVLSPDDPNNWNLRVKKMNGHTFVQAKSKRLTIVHGVNHVALAVDVTHQGKLSGLCGPLDGTYRTKIPKVHTMLDDSELNFRRG